MGQVCGISEIRSDLEQRRAELRDSSVELEEVKKSLRVMVQVASERHQKLHARLDDYLNELEDMEEERNRKSDWNRDRGLQVVAGVQEIRKDMFYCMQTLHNFRLESDQLLDALYLQHPDLHNSKPSLQVHSDSGSSINSRGGAEPLSVEVPSDHQQSELDGSTSAAHKAKSYFWRSKVDSLKLNNDGHVRDKFDIETDIPGTKGSFFRQTSLPATHIGEHHQRPKAAEGAGSGSEDNNQTSSQDGYDAGTSSRDLYGEGDEWEESEGGLSSSRKSRKPPPMLLKSPGRRVTPKRKPNTLARDVRIRVTVTENERLGLILGERIIRDEFTREEHVDLRLVVQEFDMRKGVSAARAAGVKIGDVIHSVNGKSYNSPHQLAVAIVAATRCGNSVLLSIDRDNNAVVGPGGRHEVDESKLTRVATGTISGNKPAAKK